MTLAPRCHLGTALPQLGRHDRTRLERHDHRGCDTGGAGVRTRRDAAGDLNVDHRLHEIRAGEPLFDDRHERIGVEVVVDADGARAGAQSLKVFVGHEESAVVADDDFVDAVSELKAPIFDGHRGAFDRSEGSVDVGEFRHV